jgi:subtilisin family serine protease
LEPNRPVLFDQEVSTSVVNASLVWETSLRGAENLPEGVTGAGVTICIVDTGIDAGHPDLDYGAKVVMNVQEALPGVWTSFENTDTSVGHGTHVAGTVAGNGEASAGARRGVAPGAQLIGVTVSSADSAGYLAALDWVYEHSRPGNNPYNIRGATNSWHTSVGEYDPESALAQVIEALAFENNVITTWSAGNDGRQDPEGQNQTTSQQGNTPVAIMVAAYERNGSAVADFSSRGQVGLNHTYPDVGAPGVRIWSTAARRTGISAGSFAGGNTNPYYLAISGTSMSTPHVAGSSALLWQAAPSLRVSQRHEDYNGSDPAGWFTNPLTRIHEVEWILQATARYLPPDAEHGNPANNTEPGMDGQVHDYVQGYGIVDMRRAVAVALALEKLRGAYPDRDVTVSDALRSEAGVSYSEFTTRATDRVATGWQGEYGRFTDGVLNVLATANQTKQIFLAPGATQLEFELNFEAVDLDRKTVGDLTFAVDWNGDGTNEVTGPSAPTPSGHKTGTVSVPQERVGGVAWVNVVGTGLRLQQPLRDHVYAEWRSHYTIGVTAAIELPQGGVEAIVDKGNYSSMLAPWRLLEPSQDFAGGNLSLNESFFDVRAVSLAPERPPLRPDSEVLWPLLALLVASAAVFALSLSRSRRLADRVSRLPGGALVVAWSRRATQWPAHLRRRLAGPWSRLRGRFA